MKCSRRPHRRLSLSAIPLVPTMALAVVLLSCGEPPNRGEDGADGSETGPPAQTEPGAPSLGDAELGAASVGDAELGAASVGDAELGAASPGEADGGTPDPRAEAEPIAASMGEGAFRQAVGDDPSLDIRNIGYDQGSPSAPIKVVEFSDFGCGYCRLFNQETYPSLVDEFVDAGTVQWKFVPFAMGMFPNGDMAAQAAECAGEEGLEAFRRMRDRLFADQTGWRGSPDPAAFLARMAGEEGLDRDRFASCMEETRQADQVQINKRLGQALGVRGTPFFVINGFPVSGALPLETFREVFQTFLTQSNALPGGWLPPPRIEGETSVAEQVTNLSLGHSVGSAEAPLHLIEFSDFGCGYCRVFQEQTRPVLVRRFVETGLVRWTYVPFVLGIFPNGEAAAVAGECAGEQDQFEPLRRRLYRDQTGWRGSSDPTEFFVRLAEEEGLDVERFETCLSGSDARARVMDNTRLGREGGVRGTPFFLVNGYPISGARPIETFQDHFEIRLSARSGN